MIIDQANMTQSYNMKNQTNPFWTRGGNAQFINQNLHPITKLLVDYLFDALPKMHNSFIQPIK